MSFENDNYNKFLEECKSHFMKSGEFTDSQSCIFCDSLYNESQQIIDIKSTYQLINESESSIKDKLTVGDSRIDVNRFFSKPTGIIITDTFNNPVFPINPAPRIDTSKFDLPLIQTRFKEEYSRFKIEYLPWHFVIDYIHNDYFIFNTRPLNFKFPLSTSDVELNIKTNNIKLNENTKQFFKTKPFNLNEAIHISIIGDSYKDVYIANIYKMIGRICIRPILQYFKLNPTLWSSVWPLNIGPNFKMNLLEQHLKR